MGANSTAVWWKSESGDNYLHSFDHYVTKEEAKTLMEQSYGEEFTDYCCEFEITWG